MRIVKEAEERKNEILDAVDELCSQQGFDGTSANDILEKVGIARGTLYYHFKSKEDILDALIERYLGRLLSVAQEIAADKSLPVNERISRVILPLNINRGRAKGIIAQIHKTQNALRHQKTQKAILHGIAPVFSELIKEGFTQGQFHTPYPYECMEMVMTYANAVFGHDMEMNAYELEGRIQAFIYNMESLMPYLIQVFDNGTEGQYGSCKKPL